MPLNSFGTTRCGMMTRASRCISCSMLRSVPTLPNLRTVTGLAPLGRRKVAFGAVAAPELDDMRMSPDELKAALLDSFWGTERGLTATTDTGAEINELITQLEATNPCENPTDGTMDMLGGTWTLAYTSNSELIALLALSKLPFVTIGDIQQVIDPSLSTVLNKMTLSVPGSTTNLSTKASLTVESPKRVSLKFEQGTISTPQLATDLEIPDFASVMGQSVDLRHVKSVLEPAVGAGRNMASMVANLLQQVPDLSLPIRSQRARTWLLTTYLDDTLRISRGDAGSIFVLTKEASAELPDVIETPEDVVEYASPPPDVAVAQVDPTSEYSEVNDSMSEGTLPVDGKAAAEGQGLEKSANENMNDDPTKGKL